MTRYAVLTAVGEDRPGLVDAVSKFILESGCNLEDSRMALLGGEFAMLLLAAGEPAAVERLCAGAPSAGARCGLTLQARLTRAPGAGEAGQAGAIPYQIAAYSMDHPGIVQRLAHHLAEHGINVRALETRVSHAPTTGLPLFSLHATVDVPSRTKVAELRRELEELGARENIDIEIGPAQK